MFRIILEQVGEVTVLINLCFVEIQLKVQLELIKRKFFIISSLILFDSNRANIIWALTESWAFDTSTAKVKIQLINHTELFYACF